MVDGPGYVVLRHRDLAEYVASLGQLANHLFEPQLEGLVYDDEVHLVRIDATLLALELQQFVQPQEIRIGSVAVISLTHVAP